MLLGQIGSGSDSDKSVEQWIKKLPVEEPPAKEPSVQIPILDQITDNELNDVYATFSSAHAAPSSAIDGAFDFGPSKDGSQNRRRVLKSTRRTSNETPYERVAKEFAAVELLRLKLEEDRHRRQHELEMRWLELDTLRETNLHAREAVRAQIDRDTINIKQGFLKLLKKAIEKLSDRQ